MLLSKQNPEAFAQVQSLKLGHYLTAYDADRLSVRQYFANLGA